MKTKSRFPYLIFLPNVFLISTGAFLFFVSPKPYNLYITTIMIGSALSVIVMYNALMTLSLVGIAYPLIFIMKNETIYKAAFGFLLFSSILTVLRVLIPLRRNNIRINGFLIPLLMIFLGAVISFIFNQLSSVSIASFYRTNIYIYTIYICLFLASMSFFYHRYSSHYIYFTKAFIFSLTILSILLLIQYFTGIEMVYTFGTSIENRLRVYSGEGLGSNMLTNLYLFALPLLFFQLISTDSQNKQNRLWGLSILFFNFISFILLQSRSGYLGFFSGMLLSLIIFKPLKISVKNILILLTILIILIATIICLSHAFISNRLDVDRLSKDAVGRSMQRKAVLKIIFNNPMGVNIEEYNSSIVKYGGAKMSPHNLLLSIALRIGILGLLGYCSIFIITLLKLFRTRSAFRKEPFHYVRSAIFASLIAYFIHNIWHNANYQYELWTFMGIGVALSTKDDLTGKVMKGVAN